MDAAPVNQFGGLSLEESNANNVPVNHSGPCSASEVGKTSSQKADLNLENFTVDKSSYCHAQIRASFYPKFENEKTDQEIRTRMIDVVSKGLATLEVSLKHSGSLFMYAGHTGGAYAKNSYGNIFTAVGVFVLSRMFREAWGTQALKKEAEFNDFLEKNRMCVSMELVTAVLGDHGQRPLDDFVVVTAVTELGNGKPKFYSTSEIIAFCRIWRLPTNHVWLFSTRKSVTSFFAAFDALCEEGIATSVCRALDEVADISVPGSKDHVKVQGEILEGLVARIVSSGSARDMEDVLRDHPPPPCDGANLDLGLSLREICAAHRSSEQQQIRELLKSVGRSFCPNNLDWFGDESVDRYPKNADKSVVTKFLESQPADYSTSKLQEMVRLIKNRRLPAAFKCYHNFHRANDVSPDNLFYKLVVHVRSDSAFRRYQKEMRVMPGLWPLYRGFFVDINLFKSNKGSDPMTLKSLDNTVKDAGEKGKDGLDDDDANLMIKLKFLTYKLRTFLIRNYLPILFKEGPAAYKASYLGQMNRWGTSIGKQKELSKMLDEWAAHIIRKCGNNQLSSSVYLSEAEPFLKQYAERSPENQVLIGSAGNIVRAEDFLAIVDGDLDEEGDLVKKEKVTPATPEPAMQEAVQKNEGLIVFFPGIPGSAKSALCKELLNAPGGLGDDRPVHSLMGDLVKGKYWPKVADEHRKKPQSIMLADKNAPNEDVWRQIEVMCRKTKVTAVPVVTDSEGTESNPYSLDALAVFMFRVLQRVDHPGNLDKTSANAGNVLLMFYHLYEGNNREEFEGELIERFGSLVKMPLFRSDRSPLPDPVKSILEEGIELFQLHRRRHGRLESAKGTYAAEWSKWEKQLRDTLAANSEYFNSVQVPFESAVQQVREELKRIAKGEYKPPSSVKTQHGSITFAAVNLHVTQVQSLLEKIETTRLLSQVTPATPEPAVQEAVQKNQGLIVFFPGTPGNAKSSLCKELVNTPGGLGDDWPVRTLMGDLVKENYWEKVADELRKKPQSIMLADKNARNEDVWRQIEDMCRRNRVTGVPVISDSEGTESNPYSLDALAVFMFRVLHRVDHPRNLDKTSAKVGNVLLMFYHLYEGKNREEFEGGFIERFGSLVKMPLLRSDRSPLPDPVKSILEEGIDLFQLHSRRHGRLESAKGTYAAEWSKWEKQLRDTLAANSEYFNSVQVPFETAVQQVREELKRIAKGEYKPPSSEKTKHGSITFAAINLHVTQVHSLLEKLAASNPTVTSFLEGKKESIEEKLERAHVTLAHKRSHGVAAVARYGQHLNREVPVELTELILNDKMAAFTAHVGSVDGETIVCKNEWPHVTLWTAEGVTAKEANTLRQLYTDGKASCVVIDPPASVSGPLEFF